MDISKSFGFVFEDETWLQKVLTGGMLGLVPVVNLATLGYWLQTMKNVAADEARPLPTWQPLGDYLVRGLVAAAGSAVYAMPLVLLVAATAATSSLAGDVKSLDLLSVLGHLCASGLGCLSGLYGLLLAVWLPAALVRYAQHGVWAAFFEFSAIWRAMAHQLGGYIVALLVGWLVGLAATLIGLAFFLVGIAFAGFVAALVYAHLLGQLVREAPEPATAL